MTLTQAPPVKLQQGSLVTFLGNSNLSLSFVTQKIDFKGEWKPNINGSIFYPNLQTLNSTNLPKKSYLFSLAC